MYAKAQVLRPGALADLERSLKSEKCWKSVYSVIMWQSIPFRTTPIDTFVRMVQALPLIAWSPHFVTF